MALVSLKYKIKRYHSKKGCSKTKMKLPILAYSLIVSLTFLSCSDNHHPHSDRSIQTEQYPSSSSEPNPSEIIPAIADSLSSPQESTSQTTSHTSSSSNISIEPDYFQKGYDDGYQDGASLEKGRSYDNSLKGEDAREYRRGYFAGYPDGRADNDPDDEYLTGKNNADYYDTRDDDDWSEDGDFDDDDDGW